MNDTARLMMKARLQGHRMSELSHEYKPQSLLMPYKRAKKDLALVCFSGVLIVHFRCLMTVFKSQIYCKSLFLILTSNYFVWFPSFRGSRREPFYLLYTRENIVVQAVNDSLRIMDQVS